MGTAAAAVLLECSATATSLRKPGSTSASLTCVMTLIVDATVTHRACSSLDLVCSKEFRVVLLGDGHMPARVRRRLQTPRLQPPVKTTGARLTIESRQKQATGRHEPETCNPSAGARPSSSSSSSSSTPSPTSSSSSSSSSSS